MSPKVNLIEKLEFELAYYDVIVYHVNHNATRNPHTKLVSLGNLV